MESQINGQAVSGVPQYEITPSVIDPDQFSRILMETLTSRAIENRVNGTSSMKRSQGMIEHTKDVPSNYCKMHF